MMYLPREESRCGWFDALESPVLPKQLSGKQTADYVVIGAGFCGLAMVRRLAEHKPQARIILIDAQRVAEGSSGRNSGFVIDLPHKFSLEHPDLSYKRRILSLNKTAIKQLEQLIEKYNIDCQWSAAGKYQAAVGQRGLDNLVHFEHLLQAIDEPYQRLDKTSFANVVGSSYYSGAIYTPGCYLMQPAALVRGLARSLPDNVELLENSPVNKIERKAKIWRLSTSQGNIETPTVLLATSIFTREFGYLKHRLVPVMTFASWTRPLDDREMANHNGQINWGLTPADHAGTTLRMTKDRRILIRNSYHYAPKYSAGNKTLRHVQYQHQQALRRRYPQFSDVALTHTWGGVYAISRNFTNFFGRLDDGIYASACDNGVGVAWGTIAGTLLADLVVGERTTMLDDIQAITGMPSLNPPEPFMGTAVRVRMQLAKWLSRNEI